MKELKFSVHGKAHEEALKQRIEELGYGMGSEYPYANIIIVYPRGIFRLYNWPDTEFAAHPFPEATLDDLYNPDFIKGMGVEKEAEKEESAFERVGESVTPEIKAEIERQVQHAIEKLNKDSWKPTGIRATRIDGRHKIEMQKCINQHGQTEWRDVEKRSGMSRSEEHIDKDGNHVLKNVIFEGSITLDSGVRYSTGPEGRLCDIEMKSVTNGSVETPYGTDKHTSFI